MPGKARPHLRVKTLVNVEKSNLSTTDKECIKEIFKRYDKIVHCKYCKHWDEIYGFCKYHGVDCYGNSRFGENGFCSYGEKDVNN